MIQAAIASLHADEPRDPVEIAALYGELSRLTGSPVVELNRAAAVGEAEGPEAALAIIDRLDLDGYHYLHSTRAEMLRRAGRVREAGAPTAGPLSWCRTRPSDGSSSAASPSCRCCGPRWPRTRRRSRRS